MANFEAWLVFLILVVNVVGELQRKRTLAASRGFLAAARLSCYYICFLYLFNPIHPSPSLFSLLSFSFPPYDYMHVFFLHDFQSFNNQYTQLHQSSQK